MRELKCSKQRIPKTPSSAPVEAESYEALDSVYIAYFGESLLWYPPQKTKYTNQMQMFICTSCSVYTCVNKSKSSRSVAYGTYSLFKFLHFVYSHAVAYVVRVFDTSFLHS